MGFKLEREISEAERFNGQIQVSVLLEYRVKGKDETKSKTFTDSKEAIEFVDKHRGQYKKDAEGNWTNELAQKGKWDWFRLSSVWDTPKKK